MGTEADTCRTLITPRLQAAGWENEPHSIAEQRTFTDGRIIVHGSTARRRPGKRDRVDVILTNPPFGGEEEKGIQGNFPEAPVLISFERVQGSAIHSVYVT